MCEKRKIIHKHVRPKRKNIQFNDIWNKLRNPFDYSETYEKDTKK